jgi:GH24 family phage-related lysozyme (muramidase)
MYSSVRDAFISFNEPFEARVPFMYLDILGKVTTGIGNLIDTIPEAQSLPFVHKTDNTPATRAEIAAEWQMVKGRQDLATAPDRLDQLKRITNLRLTNDAINQIVLDKLDLNESLLKQISEFADLEDWPADAQLGLFSMTWAVGTGGIQRFRDFRAAIAVRNWDAATTQSHINETGNPGLRPRNEANRILFNNASIVVMQNLDLDILHYPEDLGASLPVTPLLPLEPPVITMLDPSNGAPGDSVVILGEHFVDVISVGFGDISVPDMTVDSDTQITVTVPDGSGNVPVTVTTPAGSSTPSGNAEFAYL